MNMSFFFFYKTLFDSIQKKKILTYQQIIQADQNIKNKSSRNFYFIDRIGYAMI